MTTQFLESNRLLSAVHSQKKPGFLSRTAILLCALATGFLMNPAPLSAKSMQMDFDLSSYYVEHNIDSTQITGAANFRSSDKFRAGWSKGFIGDYKENFLFLINTKSGSTTMTHQLKIKYNGINKNPVSLNSCAGQNICEEIVTDKYSTSHSFELDGSTWKLDLPGSPCKSGLVCEIIVPSWHLEKTRLNKGLATPFPTAITIIEFKKGITFFDSISGKKWLTFMKPESGEITETTELKAINLSDRGKVILSYSDSALVFDFLNDRVFEMTKSKVSKIEGPMTTLSQGKTHILFDAETADIQDQIPLTITDHAIVWPDYQFEFRADEIEPGKILGDMIDKSPRIFAAKQVITGNDSELLAISLVQKTVKLLKFDGSQFNEVSSTQIGAGVKDSDFSLVGKDIVQIQAKNIIYLTGDKKGDSFASISEGAKIKILQNGTTVEESQVKRICKWHHQYRTSENGAKKDSGLFGLCSNDSILTAIGQDTGRVEITKSKVRATLVSEDD